MTMLAIRLIRLVGSEYRYTLTNSQMFTAGGAMQMDPKQRILLNGSEKKPIQAKVLRVAIS
jgi:hypothetical protein